jgi:intein/homing endonuclease
MANTPNLRDVIREETKKCMEDPIYFMRKYVKIQHPNRGTIPFDLFPFQEDAMQHFHDDRFLLILKSRQLGITTLVAAYSLWLSIFNSDKSILIISIKQEVSKEIVTKVRFANEHLPSWLKVKETTNNHMSLRFENGSQVAATSSSRDAGRSKALSLLIIDEAAFIDEAEDIWTSCFNTLSTGGRAIVLSTPNGVGNWFHKMWVNAEKKKNDFKTLKLPWQLHPERNQHWRDEQTKQLGVKGANQECDCDFLSSGTNVIDLMILKEYEENPEMVRDRIEAYRGEEWWIFKQPEEGHSYITCLPTGEFVLTNKGIKPVETISYEDKLIDKEGNETDIEDIKVREYDGKIYEITPSNTFRTTKFTDEHPILVSQNSKLNRMYKKNDVNYKFNQRYWEHDFKFIDAKNVKVGDWICYPNRYVIPNVFYDSIWGIPYVDKTRYDFYIKETPLFKTDFWWFVGIWLAEGWVYKDKKGNISIHTCHNSNEVDIINKLKIIVKSLFDRELIISTPRNNTIYCEFNSKQIGQFLEKYFGKYAGGKYIDECIKYIHDDKKKELVRGYIEGDGCILENKRKTKSATITSISLRLLEDIQDILFSVGCVSSLNLSKRPGKIIIKNKIYNTKQKYKLNIHNYSYGVLFNCEKKSKTQRTSDCYLSNDLKYIYLRVKKIKESEYNGLVHNFTTKSGTFLCENITTHNCADPARGDGLDYSAAHIIDVDTLEQVAEYHGQLSMKDFGNELVAMSTRYNDALLIVEYNGLGPAVLQQIIDREYKNTFYSSLDLKVIEVHRQLTNRFNAEDKKLKPGFSTTISTRPVIISKLEAYFRERAVTIHSSRLIEELKTFIWENGKAQAAENYNDDLVMAFAIGLWVRDTALRLRSDGILLSKTMLDKIHVNQNNDKTPIYRAGQTSNGRDSWQMKTGGKPGDVTSLTWLLR